MEEFFLFLVGLTCFLTFTAVVGHGIWVAVAKGMEWLAGNSQPPRYANCRHCGARNVIGQDRCRICGQAASVQQAARTDDGSGAVIDGARRLFAKGLIDQATFDALITGLEREQLGVRYPATAPNPATSPQATFPLPSKADELSSIGLSSAPLADEEREREGVIPLSDTSEIIDAEIVFDPPPFAAAPTAAAASPFAPAAAPHPLDAKPEVPPPAARKKEPQRSFADMLQGFLEESNIRWGEVLAGLFIVVSSVGLVISLRNTLQKIPYFPALLFLTFTLAFHGAGLYSLRKWKLQAVSRAVLIISLLLVPLCFGAAIVLSGPGTQGHSLWHPLFLLATTAGILGGAWVCWTSSQEVAARSAATLTAAILGTSASQILIHRVVTPATPLGWLIGLGSLPVAFFLATAVDQAWQASRVKQLSWRRAQPLLLAAGVGLFSLLMPLALLVSQAVSIREALAALSPVLCLPAVALMAIGSFVQQRTVSPRLGQLRTIGTGLAIVAGLLLILCLVAAWPRPGLLIAVGLVNAVALIALALLAQLPPLTIAGGGCLAIAAVIGLHWSQGRLNSDEFSPGVQLMRAVVSGRTALLLAILGAGYGALGGWLVRSRRKELGTMWLATAGCLAVLCLLISLYIGFAPEVPPIADPDLATPLLLAFAVLLLAVGRVMPHVAIAAGGSAALWAGLVHAFWRCEPVRQWLLGIKLLPERPVVAATLLFASIVALLVLEVSALPCWFTKETYEEWKLSKRFRHWVLPLSLASLAASVVVLPWLFWIKPEQLALHATCWMAIASVWLILAYAHREAAGMTAFQIAATLAALHLVAYRHFGSGDVDDWFWSEPHLAQQLATLAGCALAWTVFRRASEPLPLTRRLMRPPWPSVDQALLPLATFGLLALACAINLPDALGELAFEKPEPHFPLSTSSWFAAGTLLVACLVACWERWRVENAVWLLVATAIPFILPATYVAEHTAVASALRWLLAVHVLLATAALVFRNQLATLWKALPGSDSRPLAKGDVLGLELLALLLGGLPIVVITVGAVVQGTSGVALAGPTAASLLGRIGMTANYGIPLLALVAGCLALAVRNQQAAYAFGGFILFQGAANLALLLTLSHMSAITATIAAVMALQWNLVAAALYGLVWRSVARWIEPAIDLAAPRKWHEALRAPRLANAPVFLSVLLVRVLAFWCIAQIFLTPATIARGEERLGDFTSYIGWGLTLALIALRTRRTPTAWLDTGLLSAATLVGLVAGSIDAFDVLRAWHAYHSLELSCLVLLLASTGMLWGMFPVRVPQMDTISSSVRRIAWAGISFGALLIAFAVRGAEADPWRPWISLGLLASVAAAYAGLALHERRQGIAWLQAAAMLVLAWLAWDAIFPNRSWWPVFDEPLALLPALVIGGCLSAAIFLSAELYYLKREKLPFDPDSLLPTQHRGLTVLALLALALCVLSSAFLLLDAQPPFWMRAGVLTTILALLVMGLLLVATLWDRGSSQVFRCLYAWGALAVTLAIFCAFRPVSNVGLPLTLAFAVYITSTSHLFHRGPKLAVMGDAWGIPDPVDGLVRLDRWLPGLNAFVSIALAAVSFLEVLTHRARTDRIAASLVPALVGWGMAALAQQRRRTLMQQLALFLVSCSVVLMGWADIEPEHTADFWLERAIRLLLALGIVTFGYGLAAPRWIVKEGDWPLAFRRAGGLAGALAIAALVAVLSLEAALYVPGEGAPVNGPQVLIVSLVLLGLIAGLLAIALAPEHDPLHLSEAGRMGYVYGAQVVLVLLIAHLHLTRPAWFETLRPYWPYLLLGVAFTWTALGEIFRRAGRPVLAQPLANTGAALPLLPAAGFWLVQSSADYAAILFIATILYAVLAQQKRSVLAGLAAAAAGNAALWVLWSRADALNFWNHPQLWLIPPAASALVAAQINRNRLNAAALTGIRYVSLIVIYLSSTSELFLRGAGESLWPPVILACVALLGAAAGVMLRIRAFLYLGSGFALIALVSMVWHASRAIEHVWPWWAFGIGMGIAILVLFGVFEKRRSEMMQLVDRLRQWEQ